eukprot:9474235-Pyramimonas_sp.AAC.1
MTYILLVLFWDVECTLAVIGTGGPGRALLEEVDGAVQPVELAAVVVVLHEGDNLAVGELAQLVVPADLVDVG